LKHAIWTTPWNLSQNIREQDLALGKSARPLTSMKWFVKAKSAGGKRLTLAERHDITAIAIYLHEVITASGALKIDLHQGATGYIVLLLLRVDRIFAFFDSLKSRCQSLLRPLSTNAWADALPSREDRRFLVGRHGRTRALQWSDAIQASPPRARRSAFSSLARAVVSPLQSPSARARSRRIDRARRSHRPASPSDRRASARRVLVSVKQHRRIFGHLLARSFTARNHARREISPTPKAVCTSKPPLDSRRARAVTY
jgi:hypothetical protein